MVGEIRGPRDGVADGEEKKLEPRSAAATACA